MLPRDIFIKCDYVWHRNIANTFLSLKSGSSYIEAITQENQTLIQLEPRVSNNVSSVIVSVSLALQ